MRTYLWLGAFSVVSSCQLCTVYADNSAVGISPASSSSSSSCSDWGGIGIAMVCLAPYPPALCPQAKNYVNRDGSEAVDACSVRPMDRTERHGNGNANTNGNRYANDRDIAIDVTLAIDIDIDIANDIDSDIDHDIGHGGLGKGLYLHESQPSACPVPSLPPIAPVMGPSLASFFFDRGPELESRWTQQRAAMGDKVRQLDDYDDDDHGDIDDDHGEDAPDDFLVEACRAVATGEPFALEAVIAANERDQERKVLEEDEDEEMSLAMSILGVVENVTGYVGSLVKEILPSWANPTAGQIRRADECFREVGFMPDRPGWDPYATKHPSFEAFTPAASDASNASDASASSGNSASGIDYVGGSWVYCAHHKRLVQHDPVFVCPSDAATGRSADPLSPPSLTIEHRRGEGHDDDDGEDAEDSLIDALLAADRARYEAEHMQLALYVDPDFDIPAAVEARLGRNIAELTDERAGIDAVMESIFERDEQEDRRVALERHITNQIQQLLSGGVDTQREEEELLPPVCHESDFYTFAPADESNTKCDALPDISRAPPMDECTAQETLHGNDLHASSRSDCRRYLQRFPFRFTAVATENNASFFHDLSSSLFHVPESLSYTPGPRGLERLVVFLEGVWTDMLQRIEPVLRPLQLRMAKLFEQVVSLVNDSIAYHPKLAQGGTAVHMDRFIEASTAQTGTAATSRMVLEYSMSIKFDAFLPDGFNPTRYMANRQAEKCFAEVDRLVGDLRAAPSTAGTADTASTPAMDTADDDTSWMYCAYTDSLVTVDPAVLASNANALRLSPLLIAEDGEGEEEEIPTASLSDTRGETPPLRRQRREVERLVKVMEGVWTNARQTVAPLYRRLPMGVRDAIENVAEPVASASSAFFCRFIGIGCGTSTPRPAVTDTTATATFVSSSPDTVVIIRPSSMTATVTVAADTPTVGKYTTTVVYSKA